MKISKLWFADQKFLQMDAKSLFSSFLFLVFLTFSVCSLSSSLDKSKKIKSFDSVIALDFRSDHSPFFNFLYWIYWPSVSLHNAIFIKLLGGKKKYKLGKEEQQTWRKHILPITYYITLILSHVNSFIALSLLHVWSPLTPSSIIQWLVSLLWACHLAPIMS